MILYDAEVMSKWTKISFPVHFRNTVITKIYFRFWLIPPKDAKLNLRGGPRGNFSLTDLLKTDKALFVLSGCGKPNRIVTVNG